MSKYAVPCGDFAPHDAHVPHWRPEGVPCPGLDPHESTVVSTAIDRANWDALGPRARHIITVLIPEFIAGFVEANLHYGDDNPRELGPAGQFSDIDRKVQPLRRALWEGKTLTRESPRQILFDLIGHSLLTVEMLDDDVPRRGTGPVPLAEGESP